MATPVEQRILNCFKFLKDAMDMNDKEMFRSYYEMLNDNVLKYLEDTEW